MRNTKIHFKKTRRNWSSLVPILILLMFLGIGCSNEPQPIAYGHDACSFCEMTIVSSNFASQAVSTKGKQFKYDSVECLVHHLGQDPVEMQQIWVADFHHPGVMLEAQKARFIINDSVKSPMGANLAAISNESSNSMNWGELQEKLMPESSGNNSPHGH